MESVFGLVGAVIGFAILIAITNNVIPKEGDTQILHYLLTIVWYILLVGFAIAAIIQVFRYVF